MKQAKKNLFISIIQIILFVAIGVILIIWPDLLNNVISYIVGGSLIAIGCLLIIFGLTTAAFILSLGWSLFSGTLAIIFGIVIIANPGLIKTILAIYLIVNGISKIISSLDLNKKAINLWYLDLVFGIISLVIGCVFLFIPEIADHIFSYICGAVLIINGISSLIELIVIKKGKRTLEKHISSNSSFDKQIREDYIDAEIIDEKDVEDK